jgi:hypothetical protein
VNGDAVSSSLALAKAQSPPANSSTCELVQKRVKDSGVLSPDQEGTIAIRGMLNVPGVTVRGIGRGHFLSRGRKCADDEHSNYCNRGKNRHFVV